MHPGLSRPCWVQSMKADPNKAKYQLGVYDSKLGNVLQDLGKYPCVCNELVTELMRGLRLHVTFFIKQLEELDMRQAQLGLAHSFSRGKVGPAAVSFTGCQAAGFTDLGPWQQHWQQHVCEQS